MVFSVTPVFGAFFLFPGSAQSGIEAEALRPEVVLHITSSLTILKRTRTHQAV